MFAHSSEYLQGYYNLEMCNNFANILMSEEKFLYETEL